jgi:hypothetical protein
MAVSVRFGLVGSTPGSRGSGRSASVALIYIAARWRIIVDRRRTSSATGRWVAIVARIVAGVVVARRW